MKTKLALLVVAIAVSMLAFTLTAHAAIPHLMNFQGKTTDKTGAPLNGSYNLTFRIYNTETSGTSKWSETQANIPISNGIFQVQLGSVAPLNLPFDEAYWISVEINSDGEMSPRTKLTSVPYAYKAESLAEAPLIQFYRKGFDIVSVDFNSIKISAGVMDLAGKIIATTTYSDPLQLEYLDEPKSRDWIHGSKMPNSTAYVYAYDNNGKVEFKISDEAPNLSDYYGNTAQQPYVYRRYPDTNDGIYYRYIGQMSLNNAGAPVLVNSSDDPTPITLSNISPLLFYPGVGNSIYWANDAQSWTRGRYAPPVMLKEMKYIGTGTNIIMRVLFTLAGNMCCQIFRNGVACGTPRYSAAGATYSEDLTFSSGDLIQIWTLGSGDTDVGIGVTNFRILGDDSKYHFPNAFCNTLVSK
ncbi:MAG: hypothetical protein PHQ86_09190 [Dehalococcoidales bacterium]|nr:hypothetical protein [Dehalococcoidales bacterium]